MTAVVEPDVVGALVADLEHDVTLTAASGVLDFRRFLLDDERALVSGDARLRYREHTVVRDDHVVGCLPVIDIPRVEALGRLFRTYLGLDDLSGAVRVVGGGLTIRRSSAFTCPCVDRADVLRELASDFLAESPSFDGAVIAPYLTDRDASVLLDGPFTTAGRVPENTTWCLLDIAPGVRDFDAFLAGLRASPRDIWRRDRRDSARLGLQVTEHPLDREWLARAAPLVSAVAANNGVVQPPTQSRWLLAGLRSRPGRPFVLATWLGGEVVATTICREFGGYLDVHQVGVDAEVAQRRTVYQAATYLAPVQYALRVGVHRVGFGFGHVGPKRLRGCRTDDLVRLVLPDGQAARRSR